MNRILLSAVLVATLVGCAAKREAQWDGATTPPTTTTDATATQSLSEEAEAAWQKRGDEASLKAAIAAWEKLAAQGGDAAVHTKLSHAWYFMADAHLRKGGTTSAPYLDAFEKGTAAGERALAASNPDFKAKVTSGEGVEKAIAVIGKESVEPAYWYASNLGKWARAKGFATTLGNKDKIKAVMDKVLSLDPEFFHGAPHRYFGAFYSVAPGFAGGDMNKSKEHYEKAISLAPNYVGTKVLMAETYAAKLKDREQFTRLLDEVIAVPDEVIPGLEAETRNEKEKAKELKARTEELM